MKTINVTTAKETAQQLIEACLIESRNELQLSELDNNLAITSTLDTNQYQLFRKLLRGNRNPTFEKLIELAKAIYPNATITITVE